MARLLRMLVLLAVVLLVPVLPFVFFGPKVDELVERWQQTPATREATALVVIGLLAVDVLMPVPSSLVSTLAGVRLGWLGGTFVSWLGMTIGAAVGFLIARRCGRPVALWFTREDDLEQMSKASDRFGWLVLILARGIPVLAEASVLLVGIQRMGWRHFLPPVLLSNLGIAFAYSMFGDVAGRQQWLPAAMAIAVALPIMLAGLATHLLRNSSLSTTTKNSSNDVQQT